ncbi:unnamed protein product [Durusdinium trenchii]|uniref:Alpha/beta hydrolase fold-3 domain-containing protein n=1 Tax=Durusdinium trenchii TaxID=1381693 RepID=A0ABP0KKG5_9DINO
MPWAVCWDELQGRVPPLEQRQEPSRSSCLKPLAALRRGLLAQWPLVARRPAANEDLGSYQLGSQQAHQWLRRLLPRPIASTLLQRQEEKLFCEKLGGEVYTFAEEENLHLQLLRPPNSDSKSWISGSPSQFYEHAQAVAKDLGVSVATCQYRLMLTHPRADVPFDAVEDAERCVHFLHDQADELGLDRRRLVLGGLSAGGHLAAMAALERGTELGLAGLVLLNPVLDLDFRAGWRRQTPSIWLGAHLLRAVYGEEALHAKSPLHQVRSLPFPTLILHGEEDTLIPLAQSEAFMKEMRRSNNECMVVPFPQVDHDFLRVPPELAERHVSTLGEFFRSAGVLA